jgi:hypothetical protein
MHSGSLVARFASPRPDSIQREAQRFREMGLEEGRHLMVKMPEGGKKGYVSIFRKGLAYATLAFRTRFRRAADAGGRVR